MQYMTEEQLIKLLTRIADALEEHNRITQAGIKQSQEALQQRELHLQRELAFIAEQNTLQREAFSAQFASQPSTRDARMRPNEKPPFPGPDTDNLLEEMTRSIRQKRNVSLE